ncbi:family 43 glycosylhydrolase [Roseateles sp. BYS78W]|uniref:Family 43 glycosylhydrolase n=1 Tax=Pelomonas candidula TaxID=3299025 RepID=A0ABW7HFI2_9BURK
MRTMELPERLQANACGVPLDGRRPDRGDGSFVNPVLPGDHPDPCVLKDGDDYYLSCASQQFLPGVVIWHSRDLVNWSPVGAALRRPVGSVCSVDLARHAGRYFLYMAVLQGHRTALLVLHAQDIRGPWSEPVDLGLRDCLDPCHIVAEDGSRHLFVNGVRRVGLTDDGLATQGRLELAHTVALPHDAQPAYTAAGPRLFRRDGFFYMLCAAGGAGDPPGAHTLAVARSRSVRGPWENCAFNPLQGADTATWTTGGNACLVPGPDGDWWLLCHGQETGCRTLGRQGLLQPVDWGRDGWFRHRASALGRPLHKPGRAASSPCLPSRCDDFSRDRLGTQWQFFDAGPNDLQRVRHAAHGLLLAGKGSGLSDCSPLTCVAMDPSYEAELEFELHGSVQGGLALFHDARSFAGIGIAEGRMHTYSYGQQHRWMQQAVHGRRHRLRLTHEHRRVSFQHAADDGPWNHTPWLHDVSALHLCRSDSMQALRLALFSAGSGEVSLKRFTYRSLGVCPPKSLVVEVAPEP